MRGEVPSVLVVGELNPYGADPRMALFHLPRGASGDRLRVIFGLRDIDYMRLFVKINACEGRWSMESARERARIALEARDLPSVVILLGAKVRLAFDGPGFYGTAVVDRGGGRKLLATLPHPSGRNLVWNDRSSVVRARLLCEAVAPWIPWGSAGGW